MTINDKICNSVCGLFTGELGKLGFTNRVVHSGQANSYYWEEYESQFGTLEICIDNGERKVKIFLLPNGDFEKIRYSLNELFVKLNLGSNQSVKTSCSSEKKLENVLKQQIHQLSAATSELKKVLIINPEFSFD